MTTRRAAPRAWRGGVLGTACLALMFLGAAQAAPKPGAPAAGDLPPPRVGADRAGDEMRLDAYAGKAVVITFWATWCPYCLKELPILKAVQDQAGRAQLQVLAVNVEDKAVFRKVAGRFENIGLTVLHDGDSRVRESYGVGGIPHLVIVGRDGRIVAVYTGYDEKSLDGIVADINRALATKP